MEVISKVIVQRSAVRSIAWLDDGLTRIIVARVGDWNTDFAACARLEPPFGERSNGRVVEDLVARRTQNIYARYGAITAYVELKIPVATEAFRAGDLRDLRSRSIDRPRFLLG